MLEAPKSYGKRTLQSRIETGNMGCGRAQCRNDQGRPKNIESEQKREGGQGVHQTLGEEHLRQWGTVRP